MKSLFLILPFLLQTSVSIAAVDTIEKSGQSLDGAPCSLTVLLDGDTVVGVKATGKGVQGELGKQEKTVTSSADWLSESEYSKYNFTQSNFIFGNGIKLRGNVSNGGATDNVEFDISGDLRNPTEVHFYESMKFTIVTFGHAEMTCQNLQ